MSNVILTQSFILQESQASRPLNHARIGWHNLGREAEWTATSESPEFEAESLRNDMTLRRWRSEDLVASITAEFDGLKEMDYVALAAHNLSGSLVSVEYLDGDLDEFLEITELVPANNNSAMILFAPVTTTQIRINITHTTPPEIGVAYVGRVLEMERAFYGGHTPVTLSRQTRILSTRGRTGQFLGRSRIARGYATSYEWQNLRAAWYRQNFDPFVEHATVAPFFIAWNPLRFPDEVAYGWVNDDIAPTNQGVRDLMSVGFSMEAFRD